MKLSLSILWRIVVLQLVAGLMLALCLRNSVLAIDPSLITWKPTIGFMIVAIALVVMQVAGKASLVRAVFGARLGLPDAFWRSLSFALALCYLFLALGNIAVVWAAPMQTWIAVKTFAPIVVLLVFVAVVPSRLLLAAQRGEARQ